MRKVCVEGEVGGSGCPNMQPLPSRQTQEDGGTVPFHSHCGWRRRGRSHTSEIVMLQQVPTSER